MQIRIQEGKNEEKNRKCKDLVIIVILFKFLKILTSFMNVNFCAIFFVFWRYWRGSSTASLKSRITVFYYSWIRIRNEKPVGSGSALRKTDGPGSAKKKKLDPNPHWEKKARSGYANNEWGSTALKVPQPCWNHYIRLGWTIGFVQSTPLRCKQCRS